MDSSTNVTLEGSITGTSNGITFSGTSSPGIFFNSTNSSNPSLSIVPNLTISTSATTFTFANQSTSNTPILTLKGPITGNFNLLNIGDATNSITVINQGLNQSTGTGALTILNGATLVLEEGSVDDGALTVNSGGILIMNSSWRGDFVNNGTLHALQNAAPAGDYTQGSGGTLVSYITQQGAMETTSNGSILYNYNLSANSPTTPYATTPAILGSATLTSSPTLQLEVQQGTYKTALTNLLVLGTTNSTLTGTFSSTITGTYGSKFTLNYANNAARLAVATQFTVLPLPIADINGHAKAVAISFFGSTGDGSSGTAFQNTHSTTISTSLTNLDPQQFATALTKMSPLATTAIHSTHSQLKVTAAGLANKKFYRAHQNYLNARKKMDYPTFGIPLTGLYIEPIGIFHHQKEIGNPPNNGQIGFDAYTYGAGTGWIEVLKEQFVLEGSASYTHTDLNWRDNYGKASWDKIYVAPFFGWFNEKAYGNFMVMGTVAFHRTDRRVQSPGIDETAKSDYNNYGILLRGNGGTRVFLGKGYWFQPDLTLNYVASFTEAYTERGAGSLNLKVRSNTSHFMQPSFRSRFTKEFYSNRDVCYAPTVFLGALANINLGDQNIQSSFKDDPNNTVFNIQGYTKTTYQLIVGSEFYMQKFDKFILTVDFEADLLSKLEVYTVKSRFEWLF